MDIETTNRCEYDTIDQEIEKLNAELAELDFYYFIVSLADDEDSLMLIDGLVTIWVVQLNQL